MFTVPGVLLGSLGFSTKRSLVIFVDRERSFIEVHVEHFQGRQNSKIFLNRQKVITFGRHHSVTSVRYRTHNNLYMLQKNNTKTVAACMRLLNELSI